MDDAPTLATHCDGLIFVYRMGVTSLKLARLAVNLVRQRGARILGLILNGVSLRDADYYYTAYYYSLYTCGRPRLGPDPGAVEARRRPGGGQLLAGLKDDETAPDADPRAALLAEEPANRDGSPQRSPELPGL
jgi:Mrp family chromosome partitioning ATPase